MISRLLIISPNRASRDPGVLQTLCDLSKDARIALLIREPDADEETLHILFNQFKTATAQIILHTKTPFHAAQLRRNPSWGLHLSASENALQWRSTVTGPLGQSTHTVDAARKAFGQQVDYVTLSPMFTPTSKPDDTRPTVSFDALHQVNTLGPTFALGGIQPQRFKALRQRGIWGAAVMGDIFKSERRLSDYF